MDLGCRDRPGVMKEVCWPKFSLAVLNKDLIYISSLRIRGARHPHQAMYQSV